MYGNLQNRRDDNGMKNDLSVLQFKRHAPTEDEKRDAQVRADNADNDLRLIAATPQGQRFLRRLFKVSGLFDNALDCVRNDDPHMAMTLAAVEGKKAVGFSFFKDLMRIDPKLCVLLMREPEEKAHA